MSGMILLPYTANIKHVYNIYTLVWRCINVIHNLFVFAEHVNVIRFMLFSFEGAISIINIIQRNYYSDFVQI